MIVLVSRASILQLLKHTEDVLMRQMRYNHHVADIVLDFARLLVGSTKTNIDYAMVDGLAPVEPAALH